MEDAQQVAEDQFVQVLDSYDEEKWLQSELEKLDVPQPMKMIQARKKGKTTQGMTPGQGECRDFLNSLIRLLPST